MTALLKEKLGGEEGPLETITFDQLLTQLTKDIEQSSDDQMLLFDGFPYEFANLQRVVHACGAPKNIVPLPFKLSIQALCVF